MRMKRSLVFALLSLSILIDSVVSAQDHWPIFSTIVISFRRSSAFSFASPLKGCNQSPGF